MDRKSGYRSRVGFFALSVLVSLLLPAIAAFPGPASSAAAEAPGSSAGEQGTGFTATASYPLEITSPLSLAFVPSPPRVGGKVSASFRIRNLTGTQLTIQRLMVRIRSEDKAQDISGFTGIVLDPGAEYSFKASRVLSYAGDFQAQVMAKIDGSWARIKNNVPVSLSVYRYGWKLQSSGTSAKLNAVSALDANHVWAVGESGTIIFYDGSKWVKQSSGTSEELLAVHALASDCVWAVGRKGTIRFFNGSSWTSRSCGLNVDLSDVFAVSRSVIWLIGSSYEAGGYLLKSTDGGRNWSTKYHEAEFWFGDIDVINANLIWLSGGDNVVGEGGFIWKCTNDGSNLTTSSAVYGWYDGMDASGDTVVWAVGCDFSLSDGKYIINKTEDAGATWKTQLSWDAHVWDPNPPPSKAPVDVKALNKTSCWVVGKNGFIRFTIDGGNNWQFQSSPATGDLLGVDACDYNHAWAVGTGGAVISYGQL